MSAIHTGAVISGWSHWYLLKSSCSSSSMVVGEFLNTWNRWVQVICPLKPLSMSCHSKANRGWLWVPEASQNIQWLKLPMGAAWLTIAMFTADQCPLAFGSKELVLQASKIFLFWGCGRYFLYIHFKCFPLSTSPLQKPLIPSTIPLPLWGCSSTHPFPSFHPCTPYTGTSNIQMGLVQNSIRPSMKTQYQYSSNYSKQ